MTATSTQDFKMQQSRMIARIGCIGAVVVLVLLVSIGAIAIRAELARKRAVAEKSLALIREQVAKSPGVLDRMLVFRCGGGASDSVKNAKSAVDRLSATPSMSELDAAWAKIELAWSDVSQACSEHINELAFIDLTTEMEGIRNRKSVEKGKYAQSADIYNAALSSFPAKICAGSMKPLEK